MFTREMTREEFDRKLRENRLNDGLIKADEDVAEPQQDPDIDEDAELKDQIRDVLDWRGYVVSDELIEDGLEGYDNRGGTGDSKDIADFIERAFLTEDETPESLVGKRYEIDGRQFIVDSVDEDAEEITLRDITFQSSVGFRSEPLDFIRQYTPIEENPQELPAEKETPPTEPVWEQTEGGEVARVRIDLVPDHQRAAKEESLTPSWEQAKRRSRPQTFDPHPDIPMSQRHNYRITDDNLGAGGAKSKFRANIEAIKTLQAVESENRFATPEEQELLVRYVGWGGLPQAFDPDNEQWKNEYLELNALLSPEEWQSARSTTLNAHYTSPTVIKAIYKAVENMGFRTGNILEPSCGIGNFFGLLPESMSESRLCGVELDSLTGRIARQLYQKNSIAIQGFETTELPDSFFDLAIGNVPFGEYKVLDKKYDKHNFLIHDYFFARTLDKVRPGGIVAFVTSKGTMDKQNFAVRRYIAQRADLLGAIRLPNTAFKSNAGTEVTTDIIFLQKRDRIIDIEPDWVHLGQTEGGVPVNSYFVEHPDMILGEMAFDDRMYGNRSDTTCNPIPDSELGEQLDEAITNIHAEITEYERDEDEPEGDNAIPADPSVRNFSYTEVDGQIYYRQDSRMLPQELPVTTANRIKGMISLRECVRRLISYQTEDYPESDIQSEQARLNRLYDHFKKGSADQPKAEVVKQVQNRVYHNAADRARSAGQSTKAVRQSGKSVRQSAKTIKSTSKSTIKTAQKTVKTAERSAKTAIKTTQQTAKTAQKTAQAAAKAAKAAVQASRAAAKAAVQTAKIAAKVTIATVKVIIAAAKALISAIAAGGWIAVVIILIICMVGLLLGSCFGIFFSGEDSGTGQTMQTAVQEINAEYDSHIEEIKSSSHYDILEMSGTRVAWKEVLAVYAVKTTTDSDDPQEVATVDSAKKELLESIFWDMNAISHRTQTKTETQITESDDDHGNIVETEASVTRIYLYITVTHKTADEMANQYGFSADQKKQLAELLDEKNDTLWSQVLYGISGDEGKIVTVALSQLGNSGGQPYWSWYGFNSRVEWCACFVSWCANECGYIDTGVIPKYAGCVWGVEWFRERDRWQDNSYAPNPGDIIFFDWDKGGGQDGESDHTGIVEKVENGKVYTVEGNSGDACREKSYPLGYYEILGYGIPAY